MRKNIWHLVRVAPEVRNLPGEVGSEGRGLPPIGACLPAKSGNVPCLARILQCYQRTHAAAEYAVLKWKAFSEPCAGAA